MLTLVERMDEEFIKMLQACDAHSTEYVERFVWNEPAFLLFFLLEHCMYLIVLIYCLIGKFQYFNLLVNLNTKYNSVFYLQIER